MHWGWVALLVLIVMAIYSKFINARRYNYIMNEKYILLAIDVPKEIVANLRAVEQIFAHLHGIDTNADFIEKYWEGEMQLSISLEIISIDGYIQFIIRTPEKYRDLVEAAIYAQYPEAEITEVEDYVNKLELEFPNEEYDLYGTEWKLAAKECYPILTYPFFEHSLSQELADPMASLLEVFSRLANGEQIWLQLVLSPEDKGDKWRAEGKKIIKKILGEKVKSGTGDLMYFPRQVLHGLTESLTASIVPPTALEEGIGTASEKSERIRLSPRERTTVEAIENKISKIAYRVKMRTLYMAPKEVFSKSKGDRPVRGALKQFTATDLNSFKQDKRYRTRAKYWFKKTRLTWRRRKILRRFRLRWNSALSTGFIMTTDELASVYHFPTETVKAPLIKKIESRKKEPPSGLPIETMPALERVTTEEAELSTEPEEEAPANLPTE